MYKIILNIHIISAFIFIAISYFIAIKWKIKKSNNKNGENIVKIAHKLTSIFGWATFLTGTYLLYLVEGQFFHFTWMRLSIGLFIFIQLIDHFWADVIEEKIIKNEIYKNTYLLNIWIITKPINYSIIMLLMYVKPM